VATMEHPMPGTTAGHEDVLAVRSLASFVEGANKGAIETMLSLVVQVNSLESNRWNQDRRILFDFLRVT
jgi:hypothetical protein